MKGGGLGEAGPLVRETRIESIRNVLKSAQEKDADFVLLCGDIFEHNMVSQEMVKKVVTILNQYPRIPIFLLPGNHDILGSDCVYERPIFQRIKHLTILCKSDIVQVGGATLHPCPVLSRLTTQDLTAKIPSVRDKDGIHIGVAHGSLVGKCPVSNWEDTVLPVDPSCIERTGMDYLALGHWHSHRAFDDEAGVSRIAYSGTHEQTKFGEDTAGQCLLVEIDKKGARPRISTIRTGQLTWRSDEFEMKDSASLDELKRHLEAIRGTDMVRLVLHGELPLELKQELENMLEFQATLHKNLRVESESLNITVPPQSDAPFDFGDPILNQTETYLRQSLAEASDPKHRRIIVEALAHLQRCGKEVGA
jgi:DNA repair exonuclease SbcCD nuclease subunit